MAFRTNFYTCTVQENPYIDTVTIIGMIIVNLENIKVINRFMCITTNGNISCFIYTNCDTKNEIRCHT